MINILIISVSVAFLLLAWLKTNVFAIYMKKFKLDWLFPTLYVYWNDDQITPIHSRLTFLEYLLKDNPESFFVQLLTCSVCLSFWAGIVAGFFVGFYYSLFIAALSIAIYSILVILFEKSSH